MASVVARVKEQGITIELSQEAKDFLIDKGFDPVYGARPLKRTIQRYLEDPLAQELISNSIKPGQAVHVVRGEGEQLLFREEAPIAH